MDSASRFLALLAPLGGAATVVVEYRMSLASPLLSVFQYSNFAVYLKRTNSKAERLLRQEGRERFSSKHAEERIHPMCDNALLIERNADGTSRLRERTGAAVPNWPRGMWMCHSRSLSNSRFVTCAGLSNSRFVTCAGRDSGSSLSHCTDEATRTCLIVGVNPYRGIDSLRNPTAQMVKTAKLRDSCNCG